MTIMGAIAGAAIGAVSDAAVSGMQTSASIVNTNNTNKTNLQIAQETNKVNAENVAATNKVNAENVAATNQANKDIAQMSNEHNEAMLNKQIQQEWDMWNAENDYNSPAAQMQRYKDAGVNPYMAMGNVSSGNASSMSSPAAQPAVVPQMQAAQADAPLAQGATMMPADMSGLSGLRGIASRFVELMQAKEDIKGKQLENQGKEIENNFKADMFMVNMYKAMQDAGLSRSKRLGQDIVNQFQPEMLSSELNQRKTDTMFRNLEAQGQLIANLSAMQWYKVLPVQIQQTIQQKAVEINNLRLMGKLTTAETRVKVHEAVTEFYKSRLAHDQAAISNATLNTQIRKVEAELTHAINNSGPDNPWHWYDTRIDQIGKRPWFGSGEDGVYTPGLLW